MCEVVRIGSAVAFVCGCGADRDCEDPYAERMARAHMEEQERRAEIEETERRRTREVLEALGEPDPDDVEDRSYLVRIPGRRRVWNHPLVA